LDGFLSAFSAPEHAVFSSPFLYDAP